MRAIQLVLGVVAVAKGILLLVDPDRLIHFGREFRRLFPAGTQEVLDRETDRVLDYARGKPGGLNALGFLVLLGGLLLVRNGSTSH